MSHSHIPDECWVIMVSPTGREMKYNDLGCRGIDYTGAVLHAIAAKPGLTKTELRIAVWGTSAQSNTGLDGVFMLLEERGFVNRHTSGRAQRFVLAEGTVLPPDFRNLPTVDLLRGM